MKVISHPRRSLGLVALLVSGSVATGCFAPENSSSGDSAASPLSTGCGGEELEGIPLEAFDVCTDPLDFAPEALEDASPVVVETVWGTNDAATSDASEIPAETTDADGAGTRVVVARAGLHLLGAGEAVIGQVLVYDKAGNGQVYELLRGNKVGRLLHSVSGIVRYAKDGTPHIVDAVARGMAKEGIRVTRIVSRCAGPIAVLLLAAELSYAGIDGALGDAAAAMGVRQQDCVDRFAKAATGVACLRAQGPRVTCVDAVKACPDAFVGANLKASCSDEAGYGDLLKSVASVLGETGNRSGGRAASNIAPDTVRESIEAGRFATDPELTCRMRSTVRGCEFLDAEVMTAEPGYDEAKACWNGASRAVTPFSDSKYSSATKCCTTDACRAFVSGMRHC